MALEKHTADSCNGKKWNRWVRCPVCEVNMEAWGPSKVNHHVFDECGDTINEWLEDRLKKKGKL